MRRPLTTLRSTFRHLHFARLLLVFFSVFSLSWPVAAQGPAGPIKPAATPSEPTRTATPAAAPDKSRPGEKHRSSGITTEPPALPPAEIIRKFAEREGEFRKERENYTWVQTLVMQTIDADGDVDGEFRQISDILFTPAGKRYEKIVFAPAPTLERIQMTEQDMKDLRDIQPFVLTTEDLPKYDVRYVGREQIDEIGTYVFDVGPRKIEKSERYFKGRIWVDDRDFAVVKTFGKAVPDIKKGKSENVFPRFETYRENIEKNYWFPTYTHADDVLHFRVSDVRIRMSVRYSEYKRFSSSGRIVGLAEDPTPRP